MSKSKEIMSTPSDAALEQLRQSFPVEQGFNRILLPRLTLVSQDIGEGKGKSYKVTTEAGTFLRESQGDEEDEETGKKVWIKDELGTEIEGVILYRRFQLKYYDGSTYTSSPIYDDASETVPLFKDKAEVDRGTVKELRSRPIYQGKSAAGKDISKLEETRILYVLFNDGIHQMNLRGTSMYAFLKYHKEVLCPAVLTRFSSEPKENGSISWSQMTFTKVRNLDAKEVKTVQDHINEIKKGISDEKAFYAESAKSDKTGDEELDAITNDASKLLE